MRRKWIVSSVAIYESIPSSTDFVILRRNGPAYWYCVAIGNRYEMFRRERRKEVRPVSPRKIMVSEVSLSFRDMFLYHRRI